MEGHGSLIDMPPTTSAAGPKKHSLRSVGGTACDEKMRAGAVQPVQIPEGGHRRQLLRKAEKPGSVSEFVRGLPRSQRRIAQGLMAPALSPSRLPAWVYAAGRRRRWAAHLDDDRQSRVTSGHGRTGRSPPQRLLTHHLLFGRMASAVPWMNALIFATSPSVSLPVKSGMPCANSP